MSRTCTTFLVLVMYQLLSAMNSPNSLPRNALCKNRFQCKEITNKLRNSITVLLKITISILIHKIQLLIYFLLQLIKNILILNN